MGILNGSKSEATIRIADIGPRDVTNINMVEGLNIATDFALVVIPLPLVLGLNTSRKTKYTLICILSLGLW